MIMTNYSRILLGSSIALLSLGILGGQTQQAKATGIDIKFDYRYDTNNFFSDQNRKDTLEEASFYFENAFNDTLDAITPSGSKTWDPNFTHPATGEQGFTDSALKNISIPANQILIFAGGYDLPGNTIGQGGPGGYSIGASSKAEFERWSNEIVSRGEQGALDDPPTDFAPWGGSIAFDTGTSWHFGDASTSVPPGQNDFLSTAIHELAHVFGIGTAPSWNNSVSGQEFTGEKSVEIFERNVPLADSYHWAEGTESQVQGLNQEVALDPSLTVGTRELLTDLDYAGLQDIGWEINSSVYSRNVPFEFSPSLGIFVVAGMFSTKKVWNAKQSKK